MGWFGPDFFSLLRRELAPVAARHRLSKVGERRVRYMTTVVYVNESRLLAFSLDYEDPCIDVTFGSIAALQPNGSVSWSSVAPTHSLLRLLRQDRPWHPWFEGGGLEHGFDPAPIVREIVAGLGRHEREVFTPWVLSTPER